MEHCKIFLENYPGVYHAGEEVKGRVECHFNSETSLRGIKIRMKCKEHNRWVGNKTYIGKNYPLYMEAMLFGSEYGNHTLQPGKYVYPFNFKLPETLPSSFTGRYGSISYILKAIVDLPLRKDYEDIFIFDVQAPIDFNFKPESLQEPATYSNEKTICCWCCSKGNITMDVEVPKIALVPGETLHFKVIVINLSSESVAALNVIFTKTTTYRATRPRRQKKITNEELINFTEHGLGAHGEHIYDLQLQIPEDMEVPNFSLCELLLTTYQLKVTCSMINALDFAVNIDLELGNIKRAELN